jgi:triosephosphate isomerase
MKTIVVANWKMNPSSRDQAEKLFDVLKGLEHEIKNIELIVCPPFVYLDLAKGLKLGAQNCFWENSGAFTGEISPLMLKNLGCQYVILGHSERRKHLKEDYQLVNKKLKAVLEDDLIPILLIGETIEEKKRGKTKEVLSWQLKTALKDVYSFREMMVVYEPVWAISTGEGMVAKPEEVKEIKEFIKMLLAEKFDIEAERIKILYGGSVDQQNATAFISSSGMNGVVVGQKSLQSDEFEKIVKNLDKLS